MIRRPVVLVLGAGASAEFGFPTGPELTKRILNYLDPALQGTMKFDYLTMFESAGFSNKRVVTFRNSLAAARVGSVDAFVAKRPGYRRVGRAAIAASLIPYEDERNLRGSPDTPGWFEHLFAAMTQSRNPFEDNELSVITFNYDRSFEHMMFRALSNLYPGGMPTGRRLLRSIPIVHLHGTLGGYPPLNNGRGRPYEPALNGRLLRQAEKAIKIIADDEDNDGVLYDDEDFERAYELLSDAEVVMILGFGFDPLNVRRLALEEHVNPNSRVIATSRGLGQEAMEGLGEDLSVGNIRLLDLTCTELLERYRSFLTD